MTTQTPVDIAGVLSLCACALSVATVAEITCGRIAVFSPEGDTFDLIAGRHSDNQSRLGVYLKAHAGDMLRVDRSGENRAEHMRRPALTLGLAVEPEVLRGIARKHELRGRGLLGRFLYSLPESNIGYRSIDTPPIPNAIESAYAAGIGRLLELTPNMDTEEPRPHILQLSPEAAAVFYRYREAVEVSLRPDGDMAEMTDWAGKLCGAVARIMGILHLCEHGLTDRIVSRPTACAAMALGNYFVEHAKAAFEEMGADADCDNARFVLAWVQRCQEPEFTRRDAHRAMQSRFRRALDMDKPLEILVERGFLREPERGASTGRPSMIYEVNPALLEETPTP